jgi:hypothetical protein
MRTIGIKPHEVAILSVVAALGLAHLAYPFGGDQALFALGALDIRQHAVLYRDFWDFKQPGIFVFYWLAGSLFGFTEVGIHTLELLWMVGLAVVLLLTVRRWGESGLVVALAPVLTVANYYVVADTWHLTQVEGLVGLPMYLAMWYASVPQASVDARRLALSGLMGGLVLVFKFMFAPILATFWITALAFKLRHRRPRGRQLARIVSPILAGLLAPLAVMVLYFAWTDTLALAWWTWVDFPRAVVRQIPLPTAWRLVGAVDWFAHRFAWLVALAVIGGWARWRRGLDALTVNLVAWCVVAGIVVVAQVQSWWEYHLLLPFVPLGVLAAVGVAALVTWARTAEPAMARWPGAVVVLAAVSLLATPALGLLMRKAMPLVQEGVTSAAARRQYQRAVSPEYATALTEVAFLQEPTSRPGRIYVLGSPLYNYLSQRGQAIPLNGWFMEVALPEQWQQVAEELGQARPPYIFVARLEAELIARHGPGLAALLQTSYRPLRESRAGRWYVLAAAPG